MPTGIAIRDARTQLFDAAERVLLRDGPSALTSRAVTAEAEVAKGVMHRHFTDFDDFLVQFILDRAKAGYTTSAALLDASAGDTVVGNLTEALIALFNSVAVAIVPLITFRDAVRERLRDTWPAGVPVLTDAVGMVAAYLDVERAAGRVQPDAPIDALAPTLIGTVHLLFADRGRPPPSREAVGTAVATVISGVVTD
ncbi:MAG: TetR/AcrR family transcriptional regulator [Stackebrandtia sp.]